jgi:hypothetical protein
MHLFHLCVCVSRIRKVPDSDLGWEDMYREGEGEPWFDWVSHRLSCTFNNIVTFQIPLDHLCVGHSDRCFASQRTISLYAYQAVPSPSSA